MPVTKLYLIRHGQSAGNAEGRFGGHSATPLSELGFQQARMTADVLCREGINAIYASDLLRAVQTATPLAELTRLEINASPVAFLAISYFAVMGPSGCPYASTYP